MSFDEIVDLTADVFYFIIFALTKPYTTARTSGWCVECGGGSSSSTLPIVLTHSSYSMLVYTIVYNPNAVCIVTCIVQCDATVTTSDCSFSVVAVRSREVLVPVQHFAHCHDTPPGATNL